MTSLEEILFTCKIKVQRHTVSKNNRQIQKNFGTGRSFIGKTTRQKDGELFLIRAIMAERIKQKRLTIIDKPVQIKLMFYFNNFFCKSGPNKGNMNKNVPDLSNLYELPQDCLTKARVWTDDRLVCSHDGSRRLPSSTGYDYLEMTIKEFLEYD